MGNQDKKVRAINLPTNTIGKRRQEILRGAYGRVNQAFEAGFMLEVITLSESIIADRLEARRAWLHSQSENKRKFATLGKLVLDLRGNGKGAIEDQADGAGDLYDAVAAWADKRNSALHEMAKVAEGDSASWEDRYAGLPKIADAGIKLSRKVGNYVKKVNKPAK